MQFVQAGVKQRGPGQRVEYMGLNAVHELAGNAAGGDQIEPAPGGHASLVETENAGRDGVAMMKIVEEPGVQRLRT